MAKTDIQLYEEAKKALLRLKGRYRTYVKGIERENALHPNTTSTPQQPKYWIYAQVLEGTFSSRFKPLTLQKMALRSTMIGKLSKREQEKYERFFGMLLTEWVGSIVTIHAGASHSPTVPSQQTFRLNVTHNVR